jgi:hypothetical protein
MPIIFSRHFQQLSGKNANIERFHCGGIFRRMAEIPPKTVFAVAERAIFNERMNEWMNEFILTNSSKPWGEKSGL